MKKFEYKVIAVPKVFAIGEEYYKKKKTKFELYK